jgi:hypothetical protein
MRRAAQLGGSLRRAGAFLRSFDAGSLKFHAIEVQHFLAQIRGLRWIHTK